MGKIIGIDLGTANCCMAVMNDGEFKVIPNAEGYHTTPSIVSFTPEGKYLVGEAAKRQAAVNPKNTVFSIKRLIGRKFSDISRERELLPYEIIEGPHGDACVEINGRTYSPSMISAMILQKLKSDAEVYLGESVTQAVITVPAYFNCKQRQATRLAGELADMEVVRIISESTAAALAYGVDKSEPFTMAVCDLGGGMFDISILNIDDVFFEVMATNGDAFLGGDDLDNAIVDYLSNEFKKKNGIDLRKNPQSLRRVREAAENAKCELSFRMNAGISIPFLTMTEDGPVHLDMTLTRGQLEGLCGSMAKQMEAVCRRCILDASIPKSNISDVILVGGMTRMPLVQKIFEDIFQQIPRKSINPDEAVAVGAAIQGGVCSGQINDVLLMDVTPLSFGIETLGGTTRMLERNTMIPVRKTEVFSTAFDNQTAMTINVVQGEDDMGGNNEMIASFTLADIAPEPREMPQIEVSFDIDANGILHVSA